MKHLPGLRDFWYVEKYIRRVLNDRIIKVNVRDNMIDIGKKKWINK